MTGRILFIDDDPSILHAFERHFADQFDIVLSDCPLQALQLIKEEEEFAVVVSDFQMPRLNGIGLHAQIRGLTPDTTRVLLTGAGDLQTAIAAVNDGHVYRFLTKPCCHFDGSLYI